MKTIEEIELKPQDRVAIREAVRILRERFPVDRVVLFGSKAKGTDQEDSDIDLLVLTSRRLKWRERDELTDSLFDLQLSADVVFNTMVLATADWTHGPYRVLPIHAEIERSGAAA
jgi:predicted nucleotidyltransferase